MPTDRRFRAGPPVVRNTNLLRVFAKFVVVSGFGWLCDTATFLVLTSAFGVGGFAANFVSSFVGVTFVWFTALRRVFDRDQVDARRFLLVYWSYQIVSALLYSQLLEAVLKNTTYFSGLPDWNHPAFVAKIVITPLNLMTNFTFMKLLTHFMRSGQNSHE